MLLAQARDLFVIGSPSGLRTRRPESGRACWLQLAFPSQFGRVAAVDICPKRCMV